MADFREIAYEVEGPTAIITLDRPDRLNAFTTVMQREMNEAFDLVDADDDVRAVIVTGRGRGFCAGADLGAGGESFDADSPSSKAAAAKGRASSADEPARPRYPRDFGGRL